MLRSAMLRCAVQMASRSNVANSAAARLIKSKTSDPGFRRRLLRALAVGGSSFAIIGSTIVFAEADAKIYGMLDRGEWGVRAKEAPAVKSAVSVDTSTVYALEEVRRHVDANSLWIVYGGDVYDVTAFLNEHPGGRETLLGAGGQDITAFWERYQIHYRKVRHASGWGIFRGATPHRASRTAVYACDWLSSGIGLSQDVLSVLAPYKIGKLSPTDAERARSPADPENAYPPRIPNARIPPALPACAAARSGRRWLPIAASRNGPMASVRARAPPP